jgi:PH domain
MGNKASTASFPTEQCLATVVKTVNTFGVTFVKAYGQSVVRKLQQLHEEQESGGPDALLAEKEGYLLERPPTATEPLITGQAVKLGEKTKNWKRRHFVATEEADGFVVYYFEKEKDATNQSKAKGSIHPCGYLVRNTTAEEDIRDKKGGKDVPDYGLVLEPLDRKRTWVLRFDSDEARSRWRNVLQYASLKCSPPLFNMRDPLLTDAFKDAYQRTRRVMGVQGYYALDRPEKDQLALLAAQACEVGPLAPLYRSIALAAAGGGAGGKATGAGSAAPTSPAAVAVGGAPASGSIDAAEADRLRAAIDKELDRLVSGVIDSAWPAILARVEMRRDAIEEIAEASLGVILREEDVKKTEIRESLMPAVRPCVKELSQPYIDIILGALLKPLYKAHKESIKIFWHRIHDIVERGLKEQELRALYKDTRWQYASLGPAFKKVSDNNNWWLALAFVPHSSRFLVFALQIRALTRGEVDDSDASGEGAIKLLSELTVMVQDLVNMLQPVSLWEVEVTFEGSIRSLVGWAIYSFVAALEVSNSEVEQAESVISSRFLIAVFPSFLLLLQRARGRVTPIECLHAVMRAMLHDSKQRQRQAITSVLRSIIIPNIRKNFTSIPQVQTALSTSVVNGYVPPASAASESSVLPFVVVPYGPAPLPSSSSAAALPTSPGSGAASAGAGSSAPALIPIPSATPIIKNKKNLAIVHGEVRASPLSEIYFDNDWFVEEILEDTVTSHVTAGIEARVNATLAKLDKLPGKLGFQAM